MAEPYKILFVDDEPDIRIIITDFLQDEGFECRTAADGLEATELLKRDKFNLLITDFRMPRMDGSELLEWCRGNDLHIPIIFITGNSELLPKELKSLDDCCASILNKPVDFNALLDEIERAKMREHSKDCSLKRSSKMQDNFTVG